MFLKLGKYVKNNYLKSPKILSLCYPDKKDEIIEKHKYEKEQ